MANKKATSSTTEDNSTETGITDEAVVETKQPQKKHFKEWLVNKKVKIVPIRDSSMWRNRAGGELDKEVNEAFRVPGTSRKLGIPWSGSQGGYYKLFDDTDRFYTREYPNELLTEKEYFERKTNQDLSQNSTFLIGSRPGDKDKKKKPLRVDIPERGLSLDLSNPVDYIKYKICLANTVGPQAYLSPTKEECFDLPSYWCYISDERLEISKVAEEINLELKAGREFANIEHSREMLIQILLCADPLSPPSWKDDTETLRVNVWKLVKNTPQYFLSLMDDPYKEEKMLVYKAVKQGLINKPSHHRYETPGGEDLGTLDQLINMLKDRDRLEYRKRLEDQTKNTEL